MRRIHSGVLKKQREGEMNSHIRKNSLTGVRSSAHDDVEGRGKQSGDHSLIIQVTSAARTTELLRRIEADANSHDRVVPSLLSRYETRLLMMHVPIYGKYCEGGQDADTGKFTMFTDQQSRYEDTGTYGLFAMIDSREMSSIWRCLPRWEM